MIQILDWQWDLEAWARVLKIPILLLGNLKFSIRMSYYGEQSVKFYMWLPASITRTRSQSITVGILCAMLIMVQAAKSSRMIFWITASVWESTEAVASSMNSILLRFSITRPRHSSCRCPTLQFSPLSTTRWTKDKVCSLSVYRCNKCFKKSLGSMVL